MKLLTHVQINPVESEVLARISLIRPILYGLLAGIKSDVLQECGGPDNIKLKMLSRAYRPGDGNIGFCFEWAVHDAIRRKDPVVLDRLETAARLCKMKGNDFNSILFGLEKNGKVQIIDTAKELLTPESRILSGAQAQPPKLRSYLNMLSAAFNRASDRNALPSSIKGLWKADLFFGATDSDRWLGTTLKINQAQLESGKGLRIGIVPTSQGKTDKVTKSETKNLVICPLPYDNSFMELFYTAWGIVQQFIAADAQLPKDVCLPVPADRQAARELVSRREFPIKDVIQALEPLSQRGLASEEEKEIGSSVEKEGESSITSTIVAPVPTLHC